MSLLSMIVLISIFVIEFNYIPDYLFCVKFETDSKHEEICFRMMGIIDDISLKVTDGGVKKIDNVISNLRVAILQKLRLECLYRDETDT